MGIIDRLRARDQLALREVMDLYGTDLMKVAFVYLKDESLAKDVLQTVFIKLYYKIDQFQGDSSLYTWLYRIMINECKMRLRSWSFKKIFYTDDLPEITNTTYPEMEVVADEEKDQIYTVILDLPLKYRIPVLLYYYKELSIKEISKILKEKESTIKTRLHRGRNLLKDRLQEKGVYGDE